MKYQALFSSKYEKKNKSLSAAILFCTLRVIGKKIRLKFRLLQFYLAL